MTDYSRTDHRSHLPDKTVRPGIDHRARGCSHRRVHRPDKRAVGRDNPHCPDIRYMPRCQDRKMNRSSTQHRFGNHGRYRRVYKRAVSPIGTRAIQANKHDTGPQYRAAGSGYVSRIDTGASKTGRLPAQSAQPARLHSGALSTTPSQLLSRSSQTSGCTSPTPSGVLY